MADHGLNDELLAPRPRGRDGDPLDVLVCVSEPTFPGCVIPVKPIALFKMTDEKGVDDTIVCVPLNDPGWQELDDLDDLTEAFQLEVAHFFSVYKQLDGKPVEIDGWYPRTDALDVIADAKRLHERERGGGEALPPLCLVRLPRRP